MPSACCAEPVARPARARERHVAHGGAVAAAAARAAAARWRRRRWCGGGVGGVEWRRRRRRSAAAATASAAVATAVAAALRERMAAAHAVAATARARAVDGRRRGRRRGRGRRQPHQPSAHGCGDSLHRGDRVHQSAPQLPQPACWAQVAPCAVSSHESATAGVHAASIHVGSVTPPRRMRGELPVGAAVEVWREAPPRRCVQVRVALE